MRRAFDVSQVRAAEAALMALLPEGALMQRAATGLATVSGELLGAVYGSRVVLLVGSGDNGGDALYAGARLADRGARVDAVLLSPEKAHASGLGALHRAGGRVADLGVAGELIDAADLVLDGIVGIGGRGGLRPEAASLAGRAASSPARVVAVDIPSGVDASTGSVEGPAVQADVTVTFGAWKGGLLVDPGAARAGVTTLIDIGLDPHLPQPVAEALQDGDVAALLPRPPRSADKYSRGVVGVVAGSAAYTGAAMLAIGGALHGGAGYVRYVAPSAPSNRGPGDAVRARWPEVVVSEGLPSEAGRVQAWTVGPGIGVDDDGRERLEDVLASSVPVLVDADGLTLLAKSGPLDRPAPTLLTPHAGELARMLGVERDEVEARRYEFARRGAEEYGAHVLLKGSTTVVAAPGGGAVRVNPTGTPALATAGSGDVLSGLGGALLAAGLSPLDAGSVAAYLHGLAARLAGPGPITAADLIDHLPEAWTVVTG